ncbi:hypothetical protein IFM89_006371 [Coptis chinensis]|uniref:Uncharacterized protein n=1 Tax=Coptis chinensis TaxID=261450 RepID=A0A835HS19_9MAGN|nr:hypothetical protein IFM89_006371 [Coptis chinensis]
MVSDYTDEFQRLFGLATAWKASLNTINSILIPLRTLLRLIWNRREAFLLSTRNSSLGLRLCMRRFSMVTDTVTHGVLLSLYVDPLKYWTELENTLKRYSGSYKELFQNYLEKDTTPLAGSSVGAIVCAIIASGSSMKEAVEATKVLAEDCRLIGTAFRLGAVLRELVKFLPDDVHTRSNGRVCDKHAFFFITIEQT